MSELIYGRHAVLETLRAGRRRIYRLWLEGDPQSTPSGIMAEIAAAAQAANLPVRTIKGGLFDRLAQQQANPQGVALEVDDYPYVEVDAILAQARKQSDAPFLLILDHVQDPQNLGTLIRTAEAMGVHGIILPDRRAARITPAVSNSSSGAVERMRVAQVTNLNRTIEELKQRNIWVAGLENDPAAPLVDPKTLGGALALVVGSEGGGLSRLTRERCDFLIRLHTVGAVESLNAAVAGSIVLYLARQARNGPGASSHT
ncbi:MAG: 23S rRNA (guanosine(2251)-2'-O)-methyltransferase RlmB [Caldilineaceae bacterium]|nr:23S rRNA (guanosine(2251)-2'-O)-methyltransferase RlmB [Caldilineaceae bacterium]